MKRVVIPRHDDHNGMAFIQVSLAWVCPQCGGPRGDIYKTRSYDGSQWLAVDGWANPCGHIDMYANVRREAVSPKLNTYSMTWRPWYDADAIYMRAEGDD